MKPYEKLKKIRTEKGITTYELSNLTGIPQSTISKMENGKRKIDAEELDLLAEALNTSINDFFEENKTRLTKEQIALGYKENIIDHEKYTEYIILDNNGEPIDNIKIIKKNMPILKTNSKWDNTAYRVSKELKQDDIDKIDEVVNALIDRYKRNNK